MRVGGHFGREELPTESRLLLRSRVEEDEKHRIEQVRVHASRLPAPVEVAGTLLRSDEAAVDVGAAAASAAEAGEGPSKTFEQLTTPIVHPEPGLDLFPRRFMDPFRQIPALVKLRDPHNTMILLC